MPFNKLVHFVKIPEVRSSGVLFFINALIFGNYAVRLPDIKQHLGISNGELGLSLLLIPLGIVLFTPVVMLFMNRLGTGKVSIITLFGTCISILILAIPHTYVGFCISLFVYGLFHGGLDVSMNGVVSALEKKRKRVYMSMAHGFWSLGAMVGALMGSMIAGLGIVYQNHFVITFLVNLFLLLTTLPHIWNIRDHTEDKLRLAWPDKRLSILILIVFIAFLGEGAIVEWNSIFFDEVLQVAPQYVGWGFAAFTATMAISRFLGDDVLAVFDQKRILTVAFSLSIIGVWGFAAGWSMWICIFAMIMAGTGCSIIVPLVFHEAGKSQVVSPSVAISMISTFGFSALLIGPPMMGFISEAASLSMSYLAVSGFYLVALVATRFL